jgi:hypothetical protein
VEDLKNVLQNKNFQSQKNKIKDYFRAPIKHIRLSIQIGKYLQNNISLKPNNRSKSFSEYINYIYSSNSGTYNIFRFLNNLYFDDETTSLKYIVKEEFKNY